MGDVLVGLVLVAIGVAFCFWGAVFLRIMIAIWGAVAGFLLGAGIVTGITGDGFLSTVLSWGVGLVVGALFAIVAYLFYAVAVVIALAAIGFTLGTDTLVALGVTWEWVLVLAGIALGVVLAVIAIAGNLPMIVLVVLSSLAGASITVAGLMLVLNRVDRDQLGVAGTTAHLDASWFWYLLYFALAILGIVTQLRLVTRWAAPVREQWA